MLEPVKSPYLVPFDGSFDIAKAHTGPPPSADHKASRKELKKRLARFVDCQRMLYAQDRYAVLLVFQAMDAGGKDSTIRAITAGLNPAACQVYSFKQPSVEELDHDFLWRTTCRLPERGRIGIFNRSYYEEVLVVRVHPEYLDHQKLPAACRGPKIWSHRFASIRDHERHLARSGTVVLKFWLNVSKDEQKQRFLSRIDVPRKNWKFSPDDINERQHWDAYMHAYEEALNATSRRWAPWYAIPADDKPFMRAVVADIVVRALAGLDIDYPKLDEALHGRMKEMRRMLEAEA